MTAWLVGVVVIYVEAMALLAVGHLALLEDLALARNTWLLTGGFPPAYLLRF